MRKRERPRPEAVDIDHLRRSTIAEGGDIMLSSRLVGGLPIINHFLERMRLKEHLHAYLGKADPRAKLAPADGILILVRNVLMAREPLYGIGDWAAECVPDLVGLGRHLPSVLNDDRIGRCLDRVFDADHQSLVLAIVAHVIREFGLQLDELHNDSTTITFSGQYDSAHPGRKVRGRPTLAITHGHNKDHRPDLKQLLFVLTISADYGVPIHFNAADGNVTDDQTHLSTWRMLCQLAGRSDFLYVADSKLAVTTTMTVIDREGGRFITVLPHTRAEDRVYRQRLLHEPPRWREVYRKVDEDTEEARDVFSVDERHSTTKEGYRLLWFLSLRKKQLDHITRTQQIERASQDLADLRSRLASPRSRLKERAKVEKAVADILKRRQAEAWLRVEIREREIEVFHQDRPGRPTKNTRYVRLAQIQYDLWYVVDTVAVATDAASDGVFPLITNDQQLSDVDVLLSYKRQPIIEKRHEQLKTDFVVAPVFLKEVARIEALLWVYFIALLVQALIERELRRNMVTNNIDSVPLYPEGRPCKAPCVRRLLDYFANIQQHVLHSGAHTTLLMTTLSKPQKTLLSLLGVTSEKYVR